MNKLIEMVAAAVIAALIIALIREVRRNHDDLIKIETYLHIDK